MFDLGRWLSKPRKPAAPSAKELRDRAQARARAAAAAGSEPLCGRAISALDVVRHAEGNLVLDEQGDWWAVYVLRGHCYQLLNLSGKEQLEGQLESALNNLGTRVKILSLVRNFDQQGYVRRLLARPQEFGLDQPYPRRWQDWCGEVADSLGSGAPVQRDFYLAVRLRSSAGSLKEGAQLAGLKIRRFFRKALGLRFVFDAEERSRALETSRRIKGRFGPKLIASPATEEDLMWLVRRSGYRAVGEPPVLKEWKPEALPLGDGGPGAGTAVGSAKRYYQPRIWEMQRLVGDVTLHARQGHLEAHHQDGVISYQRFMTVSHMPPEGMRFPGNEWAFLYLPVDLLLDFEVIPALRGERERKGRSRRARQQSAYTAEGGGEIELPMHEAARADQRLEAEHRAGKPRLDCHISFALAARTPEGLESLTQDLRQHYESYKIQLSGARSSQLELFADFLPAGPRRMGDYRQPMGSTALAGAMPIADSALGDNQGFYIGRTLPAGGVVAYDPQLPMRQKDMGGACAIVGDLGSGKTLTYQSMMLYFGLAGHECLLVDPKGDSEKFDNVPEAAGMLRKLQIAEGSETRLPVLSVYPATDKGRAQTENLLKAFLLNLLQTRDNVPLQNAIRLGTRQFMDGSAGRLTISGLVDEFWRASRDPSWAGELQEGAKLAAKELDYYRTEALAGLVLCDDADSREGALARESTDYPLTVIQTFGLTLPDRNAVQSGQLDEKERVSQAILSVVAASAYQMASRDRLSDDPPFKALGFDEAWRFLSNTTGQSLLHYLIREGRSQNVAPFILSQLWDDVQALSDLISIRFLGRNKHGERDIALGLELMGVDASPATIADVKAFSAGDFVHQDAYGQVGAMHFEPIPSRWIKQLGSRPGARADGEIPLQDSRPAQERRPSKRSAEYTANCHANGANGHANGAAPQPPVPAESAGTEYRD